MSGEAKVATEGWVVQLDKKLGDQIILADFGGFLAIGDFFGRQYYLSYCK